MHNKKCVRVIFFEIKQWCIYNNVSDPSPKT